MFNAPSLPLAASGWSTRSLKRPVWLLEPPPAKKEKRERIETLAAPLYDEQFQLFIGITRHSLSIVSQVRGLIKKRRALEVSSSHHSAQYKRKKKKRKRLRNALPRSWRHLEQSRLKPAVADLSRDLANSETFFPAKSSHEGSPLLYSLPILPIYSLYIPTYTYIPPLYSLYWYITEKPT